MNILVIDAQGEKIGIVIADAMLGEVTPAMAVAVGQMGGANLTLRRFDTAWEHYQTCLELGTPIQAVALQIGIYLFFKYLA